MGMWLGNVQTTRLVERALLTVSALGWTFSRAGRVAARGTVACLNRRRRRHYSAQRGSDDGGNPGNDAGLRQNFHVTGA